MADNTDKINILVVDDLPEKLLVLETVLEELEQKVITACSGPEALRHVLVKEFAVILLDVNMPGMDGFETASLIRKRKKSAHTPIIFITSYADEIHTAQGYSLGAVDYILSPVVPDVLRTKVKVFVELFRMTQQVKRQADERVALAQEQAARAAAEEATRRSTFLAEASKVLANSLEYETTFRGFLRFVVPFLGDLSALALLDEQGGTRQSLLAWVDPAERFCERTIEGSDGLPTPLADTVKRVLATGKSEFLQAVGREPLPASTWEASALREEEDMPRPDFEPTTAVILPLLARGKALGCLTLAMGPSGRGYGPADLALAEDLAGRAAVALDNARLYRDIQEGDRRKNEFLAMLAHELRNPLAPICNAVEILHLGGSDPAVVAKTRDLLERQVRHLVRLVDDLLDISRITRGKVQLQMEQVAVSTVVASAVETSRPLLDAHRHILEVALSKEPLLVNGDPVRLAQVLGNLLNNAAKYTEPGGHVWLSVGREGEEVVFRVRDTGMGIPAGMLSSVFDLFTQVDRSLDRSQGGLGIGLNLVRRLVEMHGGSVQAFSAGPKQGSEFVVRLPALGTCPGLGAGQPGFGAGLPTPPASVGDAQPASKCLGQRVLVAEDERVTAMTLEWILQREGHEVLTCHDGPAALAAVDAFQPDIVLLDIGLPRMDGYQVARRLREQPVGQRAMLVALTGYGQEEDRRRSSEAGFDHHLVKPIDFQYLKSLFVSAANGDHLHPIVR